LVLESLEPRHVWEIFENVLAATPRESKKEEKVRAAIKKWLQQQVESRGIAIDVREDETGNILIKVPPTPGMESCPSVMLQGHLDMVCETDRPDGFDFDTEPIPVRIMPDGEWVDADGTTLGADNGVGVSMALALLIDEDVVHGPLEILLTVDEETGLTGAFGLDVDTLDPQSRLLVNLDSEDLGVITIGSAGGGEVEFARDLSLEEPSSDMVFLRVSVSGLRGGHSGAEIHLHRANANKLVARMLSAVATDHKVVLCSWSGGSKHNAITRESEAVIGVRRVELSAVREILNREKAAIVEYYSQKVSGSVLEPDIRVTVTEVDPASHLSQDISHEVIWSINAIPHGPKNFSPQIPELVETSCNLAIVKTEENRMSVLVSARSSVDEELESFRREIGDIGRLAGWNVTISQSYPGWAPDPDSPFLQFVRKTYEEALGREVKVEAVHAGLECGIIGARIPGMQMVSIGPTVKNPHTPDERVRIEDVKIVYEFLKALLRSLPDAGL